MREVSRLNGKCTFCMFYEVEMSFYKIRTARRGDLVRNIASACGAYE